MNDGEVEVGVQVLVRADWEGSRLGLTRFGHKSFISLCLGAHSRRLASVNPGSVCTNTREIN